MIKPKIISHAGVYIDISKVKCFRLSQFIGDGKGNILIIEFLPHIECFWHPGIEEWEKEVLNSTTEIEFPDYDTAKAYAKEWSDIWQEYLDVEY